MTYVITNGMQLANELREHVAEIIFDKVDGERRIMKCTLKPQYLKEQVYNPSEDVKKGILTVWDVENKGWRSFYFGRVLSCQLINWD
jgi:hypothetical protein